MKKKERQDGGARGRARKDGVPVRVMFDGQRFRRFTPADTGEAIKRKYGLEGRLIIGSVVTRDIFRGKEQQRLLQSVSLLKERFPSVHFLLVGTGPVAEDLRRLAAALSLQEAITFAGPEDVEKSVGAMDIFCFPPWIEKMSGDRKLPDTFALARSLERFLRGPSSFAFTTKIL